MNRTEPAPKPKVTLPEAAIQEIERILSAGKDAKVTRGSKGGVKVYKENLQIKYTQS